MPEDTFKYKVELDTQGLSAQFAAVRDVVSGGLSQAAGTVAAGADVITGATNRLTSDLMMGQQLVAASIPAQMSPMLPTRGIASTTLAQAHGMPQSFMQEFGASIGLTRAPVGVFPSQFQGIARERLQERIQVGSAGMVSGAVSLGVSEGIGFIGGKAGGALLGTAIGGPVGTVIGGIAGWMIGDALMAPINDNMQARMGERARLHSLFGFNKFDSDQRMVMSDFMRTQFTKSIFSPDDFNTILPAAARGGFFRGVQQGDVSGFKSRFAEAQNALTDASFTLQTNPEGAGGVFQAFRRMGVSNRNAPGMMSQARVIAQDMAEMGEFFNPMEVAQQQLEAGAMAAQFGIAPRRGIEMFNAQSMMASRLVASGSMSDDDLALLGGNAAAAGGRLTGSLLQSQRGPLSKMFGLAFGQVDSTGKVGVNRALLDQMTSGRMNIGDLAQKISQQFGTGQDGMSKMAKLLANPQQLQSGLAGQQGQIIRSFTEDIVKTNGLDKNFQQLLMQNLFGVGEAESRALMQGLPGEKLDQENLTKGAMKLNREVEEAKAIAQTGIARDFERGIRELKDAIAGPIDSMSHSISESIAPSMKQAVDSLGNIDQKLGASQYRGNSPISVGPIIRGPNADQWMRADDPMSMQGFRSVIDSRKFPTAMISAPVAAPRVPMMSRLVDPHGSMAG